jgi:cation diffusion facilitator CzcD-associated flavoprotein CzcO
VSPQHVDVLIIGAGLSGIGTACHIARECPGKSLAILERRQALGGTWDLFRFPGVRSDSDMCTMGYEFRPWSEPRLLADGPEIRQYIADTATQFGVAGKIHYGLKVLSAEWSRDSSHWTITALHESTGETRRYLCTFLIACTGYYNYDAGYLPRFRGEENFRGTKIHPQQWPENLDFAGKRVIVIGSGATAVTLVPAMARSAAHVTMLQRSPSYIISLPAFDKVSAFLARLLPQAWVYGLARTRNILISLGIYAACRRWPRQARRFLLAHVRKRVGPDDMRHFTAYLPWDQRLCVVLDNDLFDALGAGIRGPITSSRSLRQASA